MPRPPNHRVTFKWPRRLIERAQANARRQGIEFDEFVRRCVEGRLNQIEGAQEYHRSVA